MNSAGWSSAPRSMAARLRRRPSFTARSGTTQPWSPPSTRDRRSRWSAGESGGDLQALSASVVQGEEVALVQHDQLPGSLEYEATTATLVRADEQQFRPVVPLEIHPVPGIHRYLSVGRHVVYATTDYACH